MTRRLSIAMFIDACGWEVLRQRPWFLEELQQRSSVESLFGYSSACVPAILTGRVPNQNGHWSSFYYSPETSPFRHLRHLRALPPSVVNRGRVRRWLSKGIAKAYGFTGYFQIYNVPFAELSFFDYSEKKDIFVPGGINEGPSIFDYVAEQRISAHVSNWRLTEEQNIDSLERAIERGEPSFAFLYTASLDGLMHDHTKESPLVDEKLRWYEARVRKLLELARGRYDEVRVALFSDHGMCTVEKVVDLMPQVEATGLEFGKDYAGMFDSTMMRFWFLKPHAEEKLRKALPDTDFGRWVKDEEHKEYGTYWPDGQFGDAIYALNPGVLLNPSHMGKVPLKGMHGYRPEHPDSNASLLANFEPTAKVRRITDLYGTMREMADWAA